MNAILDFFIRHLRYAGLWACLVSLTALSVAQVPIIQPGAPGEPVRELSPDEAIEIAKTSYSPADMRFMQDMIPHHHQAREMAALVADRTNRPELIDVAVEDQPPFNSMNRSISFANAAINPSWLSRVLLRVSS